MKKLMLTMGLSAAVVLSGNISVAGETVLLPSVRAIDKDIVDIFVKRRVMLPDRKKAYSLNPFECASCHANRPNNQMPIFYGNSNYSKDQWEPAIGTLAEFNWDEVPEHEDIFKIGAPQKDLLIKSW